MTFGELFAGIGGFSLGLERAGMTCKWQVEIDPYARAVLKKHWPDVRRHDDVRTFPPQGDYAVDLICGGFPCQDISYAGKGAGLAGARSGLWREFARIVGDIRPRYVVVENVAALLTRGMGDVLGTLASLGYDAEWHVIPASAVGAPHRRDRVWIVAYFNDQGQSDVPVDDESRIGLQEPTRGDVADSVCKRDALRRNGSPCSQGVVGRRCNAGGSERNSGPRCARCAGQGASDVSDANAHGAPLGRTDGRVGRSRKPSQTHCDGAGWFADGPRDHWATEPDVGRVAHGVPSRVDRLRCLGNAVVPQVVEVIGRAILAAEARMTA